LIEVRVEGELARVYDFPRSVGHGLVVLKLKVGQRSYGKCRVPRDTAGDVGTFVGAYSRQQRSNFRHLVRDVLKHLLLGSDFLVDQSRGVRCVRNKHVAPNTRELEEEESAKRTRLGNVLIRKCRIWRVFLVQFQLFNRHMAVKYILVEVLPN